VQSVQNAQACWENETKMKNVYRSITRVLPKKWHLKLKEFLKYTGMKMDYDIFIGMVAFYSVIAGIIFSFFFGAVFNKSFWIFFPLTPIALNAIVYSGIALIIDKKARGIEESLPDALQLMASNLRAGMTPDKALLLSARPEFGSLKVEIDMVGQQVTLGKNIGVALMQMAKRVKSRKLSRAVELINSGLESGGSLASLLEATSSHLREQMLVDKKIKAAITMYIIFIFTAASIITPILLGLSSFLVEILRTSLSQIDIPGGSTTGLPLSVGQISVSSKFIFTYVLAFLTINSLLASMLLGLIQKGKQRDGIRFFVPMMALALPIFLITRYLIQTLLSGLFNI
jgi:Flp pilus assembly protein TadB